MIWVYIALQMENISFIPDCVEIRPSGLEGPMIRLDSTQHTNWNTCIVIEIRPLGKQICKLHVGLIVPVCPCQNFYLSLSLSFFMSSSWWFPTPTKNKNCILFYSLCSGRVFFSWSQHSTVECFLITNILQIDTTGRNKEILELPNSLLCSVTWLHLNGNFFFSGIDFCYPKT